MRIISLLILAMLALAGCNKPLFGEQSPGAKPALWSIRSGPSTVYLFASLDRMKPIGRTWMAGKVREAFDASDTLVVQELDPDAAAFEKIYLANKAGKERLAVRDLSPGVRAKLHAALVDLGMTKDEFRSNAVSPWAMARKLDHWSAIIKSLPGANKVLSVLKARARIRHKPILGMDASGTMFASYIGLSPAAQETMLLRSIEAIPATGKTISDWTEAWMRGDAETVARLLNERHAGVPELTQALVEQPSRRWANWIVERLRHPGTVFVLVEAQHLGGPNGLPALLAAHGFKVMRAQ